MTPKFPFVTVSCYENVLNGNHSFQNCVLQKQKSINFTDYLKVTLIYVFHYSLK